MPLIKDPAAIAAVNPKGEGVRILIVDDQAVVRGAVRSALERLDLRFVVIEASSGEEALTIIEARQIDLLFCDIVLPGISGPDMLAKAQSGEGCRPFVVLMSATLTEEVRRIGAEIGVYEFLQKPFRMADIVCAITAYFQLQKVARVLLVDDSAVARKLMARILGQSLFLIDLAEADCGESALAMGRSRQFDVIFIDYNMPGINGADTAGILMQQNPAAQIVVISAEQQSGIVRSAQYAGAFAFLKKPFRASDVDAVLHDAFALKRPSLARPSHAILSNEAARRARENPAPILSAGRFGDEGVA